MVRWAPSRATAIASSSPPGDPEGRAAAPAGAARDHGELRVAPREPLDDLVDGAVSADGDDEPCAFVDRARGKLAQLSRSLRENRFAWEPEGRRAFRELGPTSADGPAFCGRVDEEDGLANGLR